MTDSQSVTRQNPRLHPDEAEYKVPLGKMSAKMWPGRVDTKGIVSSVMISLVMIGLLQFGERLDTLFTGGLFPVSGRVISIVMIGFGTAMYGVIPGIIVSDINPFIAIATGTSPIAPFWIIANPTQVLSAWLAAKIVKNPISFAYCFVNAVLATLFLTLIYIPLHVFYFHMPWTKMIPLYTAQAIATLIAPPILLYMLLKVAKNAGFIEE